MGNVGSRGGAGHRRRNNGHGGHRHHTQPPALPPTQPEAATNRYVFAATSPYPPHPNPPQYYPQYGNFYPPPPAAMSGPLPTPFDQYHRVSGTAQPPPPPIHVAGEFPVAVLPSHHHHGFFGGRYSYAPPQPIPMPFVEHQKAVTIRNDVNLKKETLRIEPDDECPGRFLVTFTFDATVAGSITVYFFAKEELNCNLTATKEESVKPVTVTFNEGLGQKFRQPSGTGIDFSLFDETELLKEGQMDAYPLVVKAQTASSIDQPLEDLKTQTPNSQITQAVFETKEHGDYQVRVVKQILWVNGTRYELQEIYGIGNSVEGDAEGNDPGKECVICLSEPSDTTVLPCRHMCMCSECAKVLRYQTNRCPICRQPVERLLEIKVNNEAEEQETQQSPPHPPSMPPLLQQQEAQV